VLFRQLQIDVLLSFIKGFLPRCLLVNEQSRGWKQNSGEISPDLLFVPRACDDLLNDFYLTAQIGNLDLQHIATL